MKRLLLSLSLAVALPSAAQTVGLFLESAKDAGTRLGTLGYVRGLIDADRVSYAFLTIARKRGEKTISLPLICVPEGGNADQGLEIVLKSFRSSPEIWHETVFANVHSTLYRAWPCSYP